MNESEIVVFMRQIWWYAGKREDFGWRRRENEIERKGGVERIWSFEN